MTLKLNCVNEVLIKRLVSNARLDKVRDAYGDLELVGSEEVLTRTVLKTTGDTWIEL